MRFRMGALCVLGVIGLGVSGCATPPETVAATTPVTTEKAETFDANAAWAEFERAFRLMYAYVDRDDFDTDAVLRRAQAMAVTAPDRAAFRSILHRMTYAWTDPHLIVGPFEDSDYNIFPTSSDLLVRKAGDQFIVQDVRAGSDADMAGVRPGWRMLAVDGVDISEAARRALMEVVPSPTEKQLNYAATLIANGKRAGAREIVFALPDGAEKSLTLPSPRLFARQVSALPPVSVSRDGAIGIVRFNNALGNNATIQAFDAALAELTDTDGLVLDFRNTPSGGNTEVARSIIGHFITEVRSYQVHEIPSLEREYTVPRRFIEQVKPRQPAYAGARTVVLGGAWTGSMGEGLVIGFDAATDAHIIAADMADLLGGLYNITLEESGARLDLGREALFHVDGTPREDFVAGHHLTHADRDSNGKDPAMAAALNYLRGPK